MKQPRGAILHGQGGLTEYITREGWAIGLLMDFDEPRNCEVMDLRKLDGWYRHQSAPTLMHTPADRQEMTDEDAAEFAGVIVTDRLSRHRDIAVISREGVESFHKYQPPELPPLLRESAAAPVSGGAAVLAVEPGTPRAGRKPREGLVSRQTAFIAFAAAQAGTVIAMMAFNLGAESTARTVVWVMQIGFLLVAGVYVYESRRARLRRRQRQCVECGYPRGVLSHHEACPECGAGFWYR